MPIRFACPVCKKTYKSTDNDGGKKMVCKQCKTTVLIPYAPAPNPMPGIPLPLRNVESDEETTTRPQEETVPEPQPEPNPSIQPDDEPVPYVPRRRRKRGVSTGVLIAIGLLAVCTLVMVIAAIIRWDRSFEH